MTISYSPAAQGSFCRKRCSTQRTRDSSSLWIFFSASFTEIFSWRQARLERYPVSAITHTLSTWDILLGTIRLQSPNRRKSSPFRESATSCLRQARLRSFSCVNLLKMEAFPLSAFQILLSSILNRLLAAAAREESSSYM